MHYTDIIESDQAEEEYLLVCDAGDEALELAAGTEREIAANITWYYCPTGLTIRRFLCAAQLIGYRRISPRSRQFMPLPERTNREYSVQVHR